MKVLIEDYRNLTAEHCGSGSMRNLIFHYCNLELDEAVVFGLGSGIDAMYIPAPGEKPPLMFFGRGGSMETDLATALDLDYTEQTESDDDKAWSDVAAEVAAGLPTMLSGDIFYLDYREYTVHFPGHRFVLLGYDDDTQSTYLADRTDEETQRCSMQALRLSRNAPVGLSSVNRWGRFSSGRVGHSLEEACRIALERSVGRMLGEKRYENMAQIDDIPDVVFGLAGIQRLASSMANWPKGEQAVVYARYIENCIARFGTGGAFFRNLFAGFLVWAHERRGDLVGEQAVVMGRQVAALWDELAVQMMAINDSKGAGDCWNNPCRILTRIHTAEEQLFYMLADGLN